MKRYLFVILIGLLYMACSDELTVKDISYVKVFTFGAADSITAYNKAFGFDYYLYFQPKTDSIIYRDLERIDPSEYSTYTGILGHKGYVDTILNLLQALQRYKNGIKPNIWPDGGVYCGPTFYVEYSDRKGIHYYYFILNGNDTLEYFSNFFHRLAERPWQKRLTSNSIVNADAEVVEATKKLGIYQKTETPYIALPCDPGIDKTQMIGSWRTIGSKFYPWRPNDYRKFTFKPNGMYVIEKIREGKSTGALTGKFKLNAKSNTFILKSEEGDYTYKIDKLNNNCFEYRRLDREDLTTRLDRL